MFKKKSMNFKSMDKSVGLFCVREASMSRPRAFTEFNTINYYEQGQAVSRVKHGPGKTRIKAK